MKDLLFLVFKKLVGDLYYKQGVMLDVVEPNYFFTYWNTNDKDEYANNLPQITRNAFKVYCYVHTSMLLEDENYVEKLLDVDFKREAEAIGLKVSKCSDFSSGLDNYVARMCTVTYTE